MKIELPDVSCTGCGACERICPKNAISMTEREDGFVYPAIDAEACVACGACMRGCHALCPPEKNEPQATCAAVYAEDVDVLARSTSGGVFYALASEVLSRGGTVYGCVFDEAYNAKIVRAERPEELVPMHGSKYVWSAAGESYPLVKADLAAGKQVLYTCLPCQAAGLRKYLGGSPEGLYVADVLCGGAPSPFAFREYLKTVAPDAAALAGLRFQFRDKSLRGAGVDCTYYKNGKKRHENFLENAFYYAFSSRSRLTWRRSCYACRYKDVKRASDLTIGDYWGVENVHPEFSVKRGVSAVLVNTPRGEALFGAVRGDLFVRDSRWEDVTVKNSLVATPGEGEVPVPARRAAFFETLRKKGWRAAERRFLRGKDRKRALRRRAIRRLLTK